MDVWIIKETCLDRQYDHAAVPIADGWTVLDIGAGLGDFSIHTAADHPATTVYAFEPAPDSAALLLENVRRNHLTNVRVFAQAVSGAAGTVHLQTDGLAPVMFHTMAARTGASARSLEVPSTTLDAIFAELRLERCDYLKIDCEGGEFEILFYARDDTLRRIHHICLEYHDGVTQFAHTDLAAFLERKRFGVHLLPNPAHRHLGLMYARNLDPSG